MPTHMHDSVQLSLLLATLVHCVFASCLAIRLGIEVEYFLPLRRLHWLVLTSDEEYGARVCCDGTKLYRNTLEQTPMIGRSRCVFDPKLGSSIQHLAKQSLICVSAMFGTFWSGVLVWNFYAACAGFKIMETKPEMKKKERQKVTPILWRQKDLE
jgi:hypothetical protein